MILRFTELLPQWVALKDREGQAVSFLCPCDCGTRVVIPFMNPIDGGEPMTGPRHWRRAGFTFDSLVLSPSIYFQSHCHITIKGGVVEDA